MKKRNFVGRPAGSARQNNATVLHSVHIPGAKHYKIRKDGQNFIFSGISPKQFKEMPGARVVGRFTSGKVAEHAAVGQQRQFEIQRQVQGQSSRISFDVYNVSKKFFHPVAYVPVAENEFLAFEKFFAAYLAVPAGVAAAGIVAAIAFAAPGGFPVNPLGIAPTVAIGGDGSEPTSEVEMIDFAGYDNVTVTADSPYVLLQNPETNDVYFSYVVKDASGNEIMTTDLIPPGKALQWNPRKDLGGGAHTVNMHVDTYDMQDTSIPYNAMNYDDVKITVQ